MADYDDENHKGATAVVAASSRPQLLLPVSSSSNSGENTAASISFDLTIQMTASGDENSTTCENAPPKQTRTLHGKKQQQHKIVVPFLVSPDDGSVSMAWDEASGCSLASVSTATATTSTNRAVRFQGITAYQQAGAAAIYTNQGGEEEDQTCNNCSNMVVKLRADISRQRSLRHKKEKALIKLAKELTKRTVEVTDRDRKIADQVEIIHKLQQQLLLQKTTLQEQQRSCNESSPAAAIEETTAHLRKELLRLQLSNDRLQGQLMNRTTTNSWPSASLLLTIVLTVMIAWLVQLWLRPSSSGGIM